MHRRRPFPRRTLILAAKSFRSSTNTVLVLELVVISQKMIE